MTDVIAPLEQEGTKAVVRSWLRRIGDQVAKDEPLVELETDKVTQEVPAPVSGILTEILLDTDAEAAPGAILGRIADQIEKPESPPVEGKPANRSLKAQDRQDVKVRLSPAVRRAAKEHGVDPSDVSGTGRNGRTTRADIEFAAAARLADNSNAPDIAIEKSSAAAETSPAGTRVLPHDRMRLAIAEHMTRSVATAPHVTALFECDFSAIIAHRRMHKAAYDRNGANLTFTAYLIAASVQAMRAAPAINSRWFDDRLEIYEHVSVGIGTAIGDKGLVVPVVAQADQLSLLGIAGRLTELTEKARANRLQPADMRGGTFTISNHGVSGSLLASPIIINQPQSSILGVGKLEKRVVVREVAGSDTIQIRPMCYVSLTIDHRVVDGHQTNAWLTRFVDLIENWPAEA